MSGVTFFSVVGLTALTGARDLCAGTAELRIAAPAPPVLRVLKLTGFLDEFELYPTLATALPA